MKRPRTTFAAPFVLVIGCGHPAIRPSPEPPTVADELLDDAPPPIDARPIDAACTPIGDIPCATDDCKPRTSGATDFEARVIRIWRIADGLGVEIERPPGVEAPDSSWDADFVDSAVPSGQRDKLYVADSTTADHVIGQLYKTCTLPGTRVRLYPRPERGRPRATPCCTNPPPPSLEPRRPDPIEARVIKVEVAGGSTLVTLGKGERDGVDRSWRATLGDSNIPCEVVRVTDRSTICKLTATDVTATKAILRKD